MQRIYNPAKVITVFLHSLACCDNTHFFPRYTHIFDVVTLCLRPDFVWKQKTNTNRAGLKDLFSSIATTSIEWIHSHIHEAFVGCCNVNQVATRRSCPSHHITSHCISVVTCYQLFCWYCPHGSHIIESLYWIGFPYTNAHAYKPSIITIWQPAIVNNSNLTSFFPMWFFSFGFVCFSSISLESYQRKNWKSHLWYLFFPQNFFRII